MKPFNITKLLTSLVLMVLVSSFVSFLIAGDPATHFGKVLTVLFAVGAIKGAFGLNFDLPTGALYDTGFAISDTTYAGEAASSFIVKAITGNDTVQGGHVYVKDGIKKKFTIPRFDADYEDFVQDRQATPTTPKGSLLVDGRTLEPEDYMIYTEFNPRDYEAHWFATQLNPTLIDRHLPSSVESVVIQEVLKRHDRYLNKALWNSDKTLTNIYKYYDGFIAKAAAAGTTNVVSTPVVLTKTNIQGELLRVYNKIPAALRYDKQMKFFMNYATYDMYMQSQIDQQYKGVDITSEGSPYFKGRLCVKINDLPDNFIFAAKGSAGMDSNLWVGMNSVEDAKLELMQLQANSEKWFIKMLMKVDVQIGWNEETVLYKL